MQDDVLKKIKEIAIKYKVQKAILFGSRARGDHSSVSDYDIIFIDSTLADEMVKNIMKDGVVIYE